MILIFGTYALFSFFRNFDFLSYYGGERAKHDQQKKKIVHLTPFLRNHTSNDYDFL